MSASHYSEFSVNNNRDYPTKLIEVVTNISLTVILGRNLNVKVFTTREFVNAATTPVIK
jgi:hypothetical protein